MLEHRARAVTHTSNREPHPDGARHTLFGTPRFCVKVKHRLRGASRHRYRTRSPSAGIPQHVRPLLLTAPESGSDRGANPLRGRVPQATPATHPTSIDPSPFHTWRVDNRFLGDLRADGDAAGLAQDPRRGDGDGQAAAPAATSTSFGCCVCLWEGRPLPESARRWPTFGVPRSARIAARSFFLFRGALSEAEIWGEPAAAGIWGLPEFSLGRTPAFVWPSDHAWCVAADVDPHWAGVGATVATIERLLSDRRLDAVATDPDSEQPAYR